MLPKRCKDGSTTIGLLYYLFGPGRANEHEDPHLVGAWAAGVRDPGRDPAATMTYLAALLDAPVDALPERRRPPQHVYHVSVRLAPEDMDRDVQVGDEQWAQIAREMLDASGMAPFGDPMAVRWVAIRHAPDHIHIVATKVRQDGKRPEIAVNGKRLSATYLDGPRMQARARELEQRYGLRLLAGPDKTASPGLTRAELEKTQRAGREVPARTELGDLVRQAAAAARSEEEFFAAIRAAGVRLKVRTGQAGEATGYAVALPGDRTAQRTAVWFSGSRLAPDLSLPRVRERWTGTASEPSPSIGRTRIERGEVWREAADHVHRAAAALGSAGDAAAAGELVALSDLLTVLGADAPPVVRRELRAAARAFERAGRAPTGRTLSSAALDDLRTTTMLLARTGRASRAGDDAALVLLLVALLLLVAAAMRWHQRRSHTVHQEAAALAGWHLRAAVEVTGGAASARPSNSPYARRYGVPAVTPQDLAAGEQLVRQVLPELSARILREQAWPALAATLATFERAGFDPADVLVDVAGRRGLGDARVVSEVLVWRLTRHLQRAAAADIPATSPIPGGVPRPRIADTEAAATPGRESRRGGAVLDGQALADVVRAAVPDLAARVLTDEAAAALGHALGAAQAAGWDPRVVLAEVAAARSLDDADSVAQVLTWRVRGWLHRQPAPTTPTAHTPGAGTPTRPTLPTAAPPAPAPRPDQGGGRGR